MDKSNKLLSSPEWQEFNQLQQRYEDEYEQKSEDTYNSLTPEARLEIFCAVVRRIYKGELEIKGSYRKVLYDVFGFGTEAYGVALNAGYMAIHNAIYSSEDTLLLLQKFAQENNIAEDKVQEFIARNLL